MSQTIQPSAAARPIPPPAKPAPRRPWRRSTREALTAYAFVAAFMILFAALLVVPLGYAGYLSLFRSQLVGGNVLAGLGNYRQALDDPLFREGVLRMARFLVIQVPSCWAPRCSSPSPWTAAGCASRVSSDRASSCRTRSPASSPR
jgi:multiple sugar transport system permease protein